MATKQKTTLNVTPIGERVLVKRVEAGEATQGGIYIPDSAKEQSQEGDVIALGSGKRLENGEVRPFEVKAGDRVLLPKYGGTEFERDGEKYVLLSEDDILGILG